MSRWARIRAVGAAALLLLGAAGMPAGAQTADGRREVALGALDRALPAMRRLGNGGAYAGLYDLADPNRRFGESMKEPMGPTDLWAQPDGTPSIGRCFLEAYRATGERAHLDGALEAANALAWTQRESGGWAWYADAGRRAPGIAPGRPERRPGVATLDDDVTQGSLRFLMELDRDVDAPWLTEAVEHGIGFLLAAQKPRGGWAQTYPPERPYHAYYTFNDDAINHTIDTLLLAHKWYGDQRAYAAALRGGDFIILSQRPAPLSGWAAQYDDDLKPAPARRFEPAALDSRVTGRNIRSLLALYRQTGQERFLKPIPAAMDWLERARQPDGGWARFYDPDSGAPIFMTPKGKRVASFQGLAPNEQKFYTWTGDFGIPQTLRTAAAVLGRTAPPPRPTDGRKPGKAGKPDKPAASRSLEQEVDAAVAALDARGLWVEDGMVRTRLFVRNCRTLARYLARTGGRAGEEQDDPATSADPRSSSPTRPGSR